jgi:hypothetical protein
MCITRARARDLPTPYTTENIRMIGRGLAWMLYERYWAYTRIEREADICWPRLSPGLRYLEGVVA